MEIFGWTIVRNTEDSLPMTHLFLGMVVAIAVGYPVGYLLIDVLGWIVLSQEQARGGYVHVFRVFAGFAALSIPLMGFMVWDCREGRHQQTRK